MARPRQNDIVYFSGRLKARLKEALSARTALIEAPSGYGKTTAAQIYMRERLPEGAIWTRHVASEESPRAAWRRFCQSLQTIDATNGEKLLTLGPPDEDSAGDAAALLRGLRSTEPAWLAIDDFHHLAPIAPMSVWKALLERDFPFPRVIIVTRPLKKSVMPYEKAGYVRLTVGDLRLTKEESLEYFTKIGLSLNHHELDELHRLAGGWIIALSLYSRHWREKGNLAPYNGRGPKGGSPVGSSISALEGLLREIVWDDLDEAGRDFLIRLSPFEAFSLKQASFILGGATPPQNVLETLTGSALSRYDPTSGLYYPHSALLEFVRAIFGGLPESARRQILRVAGDWSAGQKEREAAAAFYYRSRDFEKLMSLDFYGADDNRWLDMPGLDYPEALKDIAANCDKSMKARHPLAAIRLAFELFGHGLGQEFAALKNEMSEIVENSLSLDVSEEERNYLRGELLLLESFTRFNNISEMGGLMRRSAELTGYKTVLVTSDNSWTFSCPSVLLIFHSVTGRLNGELEDMRTYCPYYTAMSNGHGAGGPELMEAEAHFYRGDLELAGIHCRKARHEAAARGQASVLIGSALLAGRLAIITGDSLALTASLDDLNLLNSVFPVNSNRYEVDLAQSYLLGLLGRPESMIAWLREATPGSFTKRIFIQAAPFADLCRATYLNLKGESETLLGESGAVISLAEALRYPLAQIHALVHIAAAWHKIGQRQKALEALREALDLATPDLLVLPFVENHRLISPLLEEVFHRAPTNFSNLIKSLAARWTMGAQKIASRLFSSIEYLGLSARELEVASLAIEGLIIAEISSKLHISQNTVKTHLKTIYRKTGVSSRRGLKNKLGALNRPVALAVS
ncbi:MAG: LuxR C-terminal-related transcriptional regulator [Deltaproteobacteria bacterium]|jgi:LuxR family maltose regulon positive regulatory protein|nr:LuxR C-terminal-related transcriptional regulator [Deltaproteobacteria bacterium]